MYITLYANEKGELLDYPGKGMLGQTGQKWVIPEDNEMIPLPKGASLVTVPGKIPAAINSAGRLICLEKGPIIGQKVYAVAALLPQGFTRTLLPACVSKNHQEIPLLGYAAVGLKNGKVYVAAVKTDVYKNWHPVNYNTSTLPSKIEKMLKKYPKNRILKQLARCSLEYNCYTAQNIFYCRWEGGIPTMKECNAGCIACISESHYEVDSPQNRINFKPDIKEITELMLNHLLNARQAIISFGQGCEGEPSLNAKDLSQAIVTVRETTAKGTINMNTNAGYTKGIKLMCDAGLDAIRVTMFSCIEGKYNFYHRPKDYRLDNVKRSIVYAKEQGLQVSINLLTLPGFTDREEEIEHLIDFVISNQIDMIQLRNLNIDPEYLKPVLEDKAKAVGIPHFINLLKKELPGVIIGSYTHSRD